MFAINLARLSHIAAGAAVLAASALPTGPAQAQGTVKSVHADCQILCDTPPGAQGEQGALIQSVTAEDRPNVGLTVIMMQTADHNRRHMRALAPPGALLPSRLELKLSTTHVSRHG